MTIEKLPSGSYRIKQMHEGKMYSITVKQKPTKKEAVQLLAAKFNGINFANERTKFRMAALEYVEAKRNTLSPRSVREYKLYPDRLPKWFADMPIGDISKIQAQKLVNELAERLSPDTVEDLYVFANSVVQFKRPDFIVKVNLPQKIKKDMYIPSSDDVKRLLEYTLIKNPMFYVPIALASSCGLRRSEIIGLNTEDIYDGELHIKQAKVEDENNDWVYKTTKTVDSTRHVPIPPNLETRIREQGYVYQGGAQSIANFMNRSQKALGMESFTLHSLRHFYASEMLANNVPIKDVQALGGWKDDTTLRRIYAHSMRTRTKEDRTELSKALWGSIL